MTDRLACSPKLRGSFRSMASVLTLLAATSPAAAADEALPVPGPSSPARVPLSVRAPELPAQAATSPMPICAPAPSAVDAPMVDAWYGWQTLTFDGAALAMGLTLVAANPADGSTVADTLGYGAGATFLLGAPAVHLAHEHPWKALASIGLRAGLPVATALVGGFFASSSGRNGSGQSVDGAIQQFGNVWTGVVLGSLVGAVGASALDATLIAHERVPAAPPRATVGAITTWAPTVSLLPQGAAVGVRGTLF
jgi:hypothetical protein